MFWARVALKIDSLLFLFCDLPKGNLIKTKAITSEQKCLTFLTLFRLPVCLSPQIPSRHLAIRLQQLSAAIFHPRPHRLHPCPPSWLTCAISCIVEASCCEDYFQDGVDIAPKGQGGGEEGGNFSVFILDHAPQETSLSETKERPRKWSCDFGRRLRNKMVEIERPLHVGRFSDKKRSFFSRNVL